MNTVHNIILDGLWTKPSGVDTPATNEPADDPSADCGMRDLVNWIYRRGRYAPPTTDLQGNGDAAAEVFTEAFAYDAESPADEAKELHERITTIGAQEVNLFAHSFGNTMGVYFVEWLAKWKRGGGKFGPWIKRYVGFDPCRVFGFPLTSWRLEDPATVQWGASFYQSAGRPYFTSGSPFATRADASIVNYNVTDRRLVQVDDGVRNRVEDFGAGPDLAHISIYGMRGIIIEDQVRQRVRRLCLTT